MNRENKVFWELQLSDKNRQNQTKSDKTRQNQTSIGDFERKTRQIQTKPDKTRQNQTKSDKLYFLRRIRSLINLTIIFIIFRGKNDHYHQNQISLIIKFFRAVVKL